MSTTVDLQCKLKVLEFPQKLCCNGRHLNSQHYQSIPIIYFWCKMVKVIACNTLGIRVCIETDNIWINKSNCNKLR